MLKVKFSDDEFTLLYYYIHMGVLKGYNDERLIILPYHKKNNKRQQRNARLLHKIYLKLQSKI